MNMHKLFGRIFRTSFIATLVVATTMTMTMPSQSWAMLAPANLMTAPAAKNDSRAQDLKTIQTTLESKMVRQRLSEFKLTPEQINQRMSQLSDAQIHQLAMQIRAINPGGDAVGFLIGVGVLVVIVLFIIWLVKRV
jgi:hypothetical protein